MSQKIVDLLDSYTLHLTPQGRIYMNGYAKKLNEGEIWKQTTEQVFPIAYQQGADLGFEQGRTSGLTEGIIEGFTADKNIILDKETGKILSGYDVNDLNNKLNQEIKKNTFPRDTGITREIKQTRKNPVLSHKIIDKKTDKIGFIQTDKGLLIDRRNVSRARKDEAYDENDPDSFRLDGYILTSENKWDFDSLPVQEIINNSNLKTRKAPNTKKYLKRDLKEFMEKDIKKLEPPNDKSISEVKGQSLLSKKNIGNIKPPTPTPSPKRPTRRKPKGKERDDSTSSKYI